MNDYNAVMPRLSALILIACLCVLSLGCVERRLMITSEPSGALVYLNDQEIGRTLETMMGGRRVTSFIDRGEEYDVIVQVRPQDRQTTADLRNIYVHSARSDVLVPLSNVMTTRERAAAGSLNRFDRMRAITLSANLAPGYSMQEAIDYLEGVIASELPDTVRVGYKGEARELADSNRALYLTFALALLVVYLVLAAQFESFVHPAVIMTTVPLALFGALAGLALTDQSLNIYTRIGLIMLIGLAAKNGILIVEFANQRRDAGLAFLEALIDAAATRLRPILMTSISTAMGVVPLLLATGAGAESRYMIGVVVFSGTVFATVLTLFVVPAFYALLCRRTGTPAAVAQRLATLEDRPGGARAEQPAE